MYSYNMPKPRLEPMICRILGSRAHEDGASSIPEPQRACHSASHAANHTPAPAPRRWLCSYPHFSDGDSEAQRSIVTFPRSHSPAVVKMGFTPRNYPRLPRSCPAANTACCPPCPHTDVLTGAQRPADNRSSAPHWLCELGKPRSPPTYSIPMCKVRPQGASRTAE